MDTFLEYAANSNSDNAYNVRITLYAIEDGTVEHLWVFSPRPKPGSDNLYIASINEAPKLFLSEYIGAFHSAASGMVEFHFNQITDWTVIINGKVYGQYTSRVIQKRHPEFSEDYDRIMSKNPVPNSGDWP